MPISARRLILIGGPPGAGKSTLAHALARRLDTAWISCDDLVQAAKGVTTPATHPELHALSGSDYVEYFTTGPVARLIDDAMAQHAASWPAIERVIRKHARASAPIVIEGWALQPARIASLLKEFDGMTACWLHIDEDVLASRERSQESWRRTSTDPERMLRNFLGRSWWYNEFIRTEAEEHRMPVLEQDGTCDVETLCERVLALGSKGALH